MHGVRVLAVFAVVWVVVASPLLTRNVLRFRHPFHNVSTWLLFVDEYQDPDQVSQSTTVAEAAAADVGSHTWAELAAQILSRPVEPPRSIDSQIPVDVETVFRTCLQKSPADRYADSNAVADDLDRFLAG